jgi:hypothetical protein
MKRQTGIKKTLKGYQVWFTIGHQTFDLSEIIEDSEEDCIEVAQLQERMLKIALQRLAQFQERMLF